MFMKAKKKDRVCLKSKKIKQKILETGQAGSEKRGTAIIFLVVDSTSKHMIIICLAIMIIG